MDTEKNSVMPDSSFAVNFIDKRSASQNAIIFCQDNRITGFISTKFITRNAFGAG